MRTMKSLFFLILCAVLVRGAQAQSLPVLDNDAGALNGAIGEASLRGNLTSDGGAATTVYTYWGDTDGGTNPAAWDHVITNGTLAVGAFSANASGLYYGVAYHYRSSAENSAGTAWASATQSFLSKFSFAMSSPRLGWETNAWTGDATTGVSSEHLKTCAVDFNGPGTTINGVAFDSHNGSATSGSGWSIGGTASPYPNDSNDLTAGGGGSATLARNFIYGGTPRTVSVTGLTPGERYQTTFFSVAWESAGQRFQIFSARGVNALVDQDRYGDNKGIAISYCFDADATGSMDFTISPQNGGSTFHCYGLSNQAVGAPVTPITNKTATAVQPTQATLNASLTSTGAVYAVEAYWGLTNGGDDTSAWDHSASVGSFTNLAEGAVAYTANALIPSNTYYCSFRMFNAGTNFWSNVESFITGEVWLEKIADGDEATLDPGVFRAHRPDVATNAPLSVAYAQTGGTAQSGVDYAALPGSVTIPAGAASADIVVTPLKNFASQANTTLELTLTGAPAVIGASSNATLTIFNQALQSSVYVSANGDDSDGLTWETALHDLKAAVSLVGVNGTVHVAGGQTFTLDSQIVWPAMDGIAVLGGYEASGVEPGARDPGQWPTVVTRNPANNIRLMQIAGVTNTVLSGLTLTGGNVVDQRGGALHVSGSGLILDDCVVTNNRASTALTTGVAVSGGAMFAENSTVVVRGCRLVSNTATSTARNNTAHGGALAFSGGSAVLLDCDFRRNTAWGEGSSAHMNNDLAYGGAVYANGKLAVTNCLLIANQTHIGTKGDALGGALYSGGDASVWNCLIAGNAVWRSGTLAAASGHGLYATGTRLVIGQSTFSGQIDAIRLGTAPATLAVENSIFWDNSVDFVNYPLVSGALKNVADCLIGSGANNGINGCVQADPLFERGYYLASASPAVDAGSTTAAAAGLADRTTQVAGTVDQGAVDWGYHAADGVAVMDLYVSGSGADGNSGLTSGAPLRSLTKALTLAGDGTRIVVGAGQYDGTVETFPLVATDVIGLALEGAGAETAVVSALGKNARCVEFTGVWQGSLSGLTIRDGIVTGNGGGMSAVRCGLSVGACAFRQNKANRAAGGGFYAEDSSTLLSGLVVDNNQCYSDYRGCQLLGGGLGLVRGRHDVSYSRIVNNRTQGQGHGGYNVVDYPYGGGLYISGDLLLRDCVVSNNTARIASFGTSRGGGVYAEVLQSGAKVVVRDVLVATNVASRAGTSNMSELGDGVYVANGTVELASTTVGGNGGYGLYRADGTVSAVNSIFGGNGVNSQGTVTLAYSCVGPESVFTDGGHNIVGDPLFIAPAQGDFRLQTAYGQITPEGRVLRQAATSPCLDVGLHQDWMDEATDLQGLPRILRSLPGSPRDGIVDLGAFEIDMPPVGTQMIIR